MEVFDRDATRTYYTRPMPALESNVSAPIVVDALTLARNAATFDYQFRKQSFDRLSGLVISDQPSLDVQLQFDSHRGKPIVTGKVQGTVELICQRCMVPMQYLLNEQFVLSICSVDQQGASSEVDELELAHTTEMDEWVADATRLDVVALVEEQVILALPLVPKHEDEKVCAALRRSSLEATAIKPDPDKKDRKQEHEAEVEANDLRRPFANLRELLTK